MSEGGRKIGGVFIHAELLPQHRLDCHPAQLARFFNQHAHEWLTMAVAPRVMSCYAQPDLWGF